MPAFPNQAGTVVNTYAYDAYGSTTASSETVANPFRYAGEYQDAESGLYYLRARYYDPASQQFLTRDPLVAATEQAYNYAGGSPLNATDPSGLYFDTPGDYHGPTIPAIPPLWCSILGLCSPQEQIAKQYYDDLAEAYEHVIWDNMPMHIVGGMDDPGGAGQLGRSAALVGLGGPACAPDGAGGGSSETPRFTIHGEEQLNERFKGDAARITQIIDNPSRVADQLEPGNNASVYLKYTGRRADVVIMNHEGDVVTVMKNLSREDIRGLARRHQWFWH